MPSHSCAGTNRAARISGFSSGAGGERRLTFNGTEKSAVAWSPDGRQLAFVQRDEILVVDRAGGSPRSLAKFTASLAKPPLVWRDDGILIPFEIANAGYGLRRISETGEVSEVRNPCGGSLPVWSDDHSHVVCWSPLRPRVVVVRTAAGRRVRPVALYPTSQSTGVGVAGLGAKGAPVVFNATVEERDADLWLLAGKLRKLTTGPGEDFDPSWSSDRRHLVFVRGTQRSRTTGRLMLLDLARGRIRPLRPRLSGRDPDWSPDGRRVVYSRNGDLWVIRVAAGRPVRLTRGRPEDIDPTWSHDGRTIAFVRHGRATELSTLPARGGPRSVLVSRQGDLLDPDWSRDDRLLAFSTLEAISLVDAAGPHRVRTIARDLDNRLTSPSWTRDGRSLVYASGWEGNIPYPWHAPNAHYLEIWRVDVASRSARTLIDSAGFNFDPDVAR